MKYIKKKIVVVHDRKDFGSSYAPFLANLGDVSNNTDNLEGIDLLVFTGGSDIDPSLYNHKKDKRTHSQPERDAKEVEIFKRARALNIPMLGICRGAQLLCVMAGGTLLQHIDGHSGNHNIDTKDGRSIIVNSGHHQMQQPPDNAVAVAWANPPQSELGIKEYEVVYYPEIKALGIQFHPEALPSQSTGSNYALALIQSYLWGR